LRQGTVELLDEVDTVLNTVDIHEYSILAKSLLEAVIQSSSEAWIVVTPVTNEDSAEQSFPMARRS
jgi:hypothetical protein